MVPMGMADAGRRREIPARGGFFRVHEARVGLRPPNPSAIARLLPVEEQELEAVVFLLRSPGNAAPEVARTCAGAAARPR